MCHHDQLIPISAVRPLAYFSITNQVAKVDIGPRMHKDMRNQPLLFTNTIKLHSVCSIFKCQSDVSMVIHVHVCIGCVVHWYVSYLCTSRFVVGIVVSDASSGVHLKSCTNTSLWVLTQTFCCIIPDCISMNEEKKYWCIFINRLVTQSQSQLPLLQIEKQKNIGDR